MKQIKTGTLAHVCAWCKWAFVLLVEGADNKISRKYSKDFPDFHMRNKINS